MDSINICFAHHLSLKYGGGGEKWLIELAKELVNRGHDVEVYALPFSLKGSRDIDPSEILGDIPYKESYRHKIKSEVSYITYNPLNWLNFNVQGPKIGGIHSHCYWQPFSWRYGLLPNLANLVHMVTKRWELERFDAVHTVTPIYPLNLDKVYYIPNFVDSKHYSPRESNNEEFTVGYASRKVWQKGYDIYLTLEEEMKDTKFVATRNIPENMMPQFYSDNHVTLVPARVDTFGLVNVESMLCGTPVISSGLPTHRALGLPLKYAYGIDQYIKEIETLQGFFDMDVYPDISKICRQSALKYGKSRVVDQLEAMFMEVAKS